MPLCSGSGVPIQPGTSSWASGRVSGMCPICERTVFAHQSTPVNLRPALFIICDDHPRTALADNPWIADAL